jgi:DNA-binding LacI/PurR family transcriptional regulator
MALANHSTEKLAPIDNQATEKLFSRLAQTAELGLVGMGDLPMTRHSAIGLSTIPQPVAEGAAMAARLLLDLMEDGKNAGQQNNSEQ